MYIIVRKPAILFVILGAALLGGYFVFVISQINVTPLLTPANQPLEASFFTSSRLGRTIQLWLSCEDFCNDRLKAVVALGDKALPPLVQLVEYGLSSEALTLLDYQDSKYPRERALTALGELGDYRALDVIIATLSDPYLKSSAVAALGDLGGDKALYSILPLLHDEDDHVREVAAKSLQRLRRSEALLPLQQAALTETKAHVRTAIQEAIHAVLNAR